MKYALKTACTLAATLIAIGSLTGGANADVVIDITESGGDVGFNVTGSLAPSSITLVTLWNSSEVKQNGRTPIPIKMMLL